MKLIKGQPYQLVDIYGESFYYGIYLGVLVKYTTIDGETYYADSGYSDPRLHVFERSKDASPSTYRYAAALLGIDEDGSHLRVKRYGQNIETLFYDFRQTYCKVASSSRAAESSATGFPKHVEYSPDVLNGGDRGYFSPPLPKP